MYYVLKINFIDVEGVLKTSMIIFVHKVLVVYYLYHLILLLS